MRFYIDDSRGDEIKVEAKEEGNRVHIMGIDLTGRAWTLFTLLPSGTFRRPTNIRKDIGIQTDTHGRIRETT